MERTIKVYTMACNIPEGSIVRKKTGETNYRIRDRIKIVNTVIEPDKPYRFIVKLSDLSVSDIHEHTKVVAGIKAEDNEQITDLLRELKEKDDGFQFVMSLKEAPNYMDLTRAHTKKIYHKGMHGLVSKDIKITAGPGTCILLDVEKDTYISFRDDLEVFVKTKNDKEFEEVLYDVTKFIF